MTIAKPPARQRAVGALASGLATAELHHQMGHDQKWRARRDFEPTTPGLGILCSILLSYGHPSVL